MQAGRHHPSAEPRGDTEGARSRNEEPSPDRARRRARPSPQSLQPEKAFGFASKSCFNLGLVLLGQLGELVRAQIGDLDSSPSLASDAR